VVLISVAGLTPDRYAPRDGAAPEMPVLAALARAGAAAEAVEPVAPAATYPAHATLVTGERPARHGIPADLLLGDRGVRATSYSHASHLRAPTLWQRAVEAGRPVAALDWPTTVGAQIDRLLPDVVPERRGESWLALLEGSATPGLAERARALAGGRDPSPPERDALLGALACEIAGGRAPPRLLLLRLSQSEPALARHGPESAEAALAFARVDTELATLLRCLEEAGRLGTSALVVAGDRGVVPVHSVLHPNGALAAEGLLGRLGTVAPRWRAIARSNGGSAFVYATDEAAAVVARRTLEAAARESGVFRVVPAEEMLALGADSEAWFALEARPGFVFDDLAGGPLLEAAALRGASGYLPGRAEMGPGFVAWGRGVSPGVRVPWMRQSDVAPTVARLLGVELAPGDGRALVGLLARPAPVGGR
jgi:hypothetical protein